MKRNIFSLFFALLLAGFITQGFQCGSPDFTGAKVQEQNKNYREAAKLYEKTPIALRLRELQTLTEIAREKNLIIVPGGEIGTMAGIAKAVNKKAEQ